ncbi:glycosyltransferase, partial [bacterium]|nr:glycosyltransferase [bacterium]
MNAVNHPAHFLSIVIPVYNSADSLNLLVEQLEEVLPDISQQFEIILVNDGSRDDSWPTIELLIRSHPAVRGINLMRNYGQH